VCSKLIVTIQWPIIVTVFPLDLREREKENFLHIADLKIILIRFQVPKRSENLILCLTMMNLIEIAITR
jgi:hypothetical protein